MAVAQLRAGQPCPQVHTGTMLLLTTLRQLARAPVAAAAAAAAPPGAAATACCSLLWADRRASHGFASSSASGDAGSSSSSSGGTNAPPQPPQQEQLDESRQQQQQQRQPRKPPQQPLLVAQLLGPATMSRRQRLETRKAELIAAYARDSSDVGSPEVQIALLTEKIRDMAEHFKAHRKDYHGMRGLTGMLNRRRKLLSFLRDSNFERYALVLHRLGLKDTYAKQARYDKYRVGTRLGAPAEALKRYGNK